MMMLPASFGVPWPRFCADLKVELYRDSRGSSTRDSDYYVRVEYSPGLIQTLLAARVLHMHQCS